MEDLSSSYTFPFDTCEKPQSNFFISQPYSVTINFISCCIVIYFLANTSTIHATILLSSLLLFDISHTFSHFIHINPGIQVSTVHVLAYLINFAFLYALYKYTKKIPSPPFILFLIIVLFFDIYAFFNLSLFYYFFTFVLFFFSILIYYYHFLDKKIQYNIKIIFFLVVIIYLGFVNDAFHCKKMLETFPNFSFHSLLELLILCVIYFFSVSFYNI
jgi:hypothetical protein